LVADILRDDFEEDKEATKLEKQAYNIAIKTIIDKKDQWPENLEWEKEYIRYCNS